MYYKVLRTRIKPDPRHPHHEQHKATGFASIFLGAGGKDKPVSVDDVEDKIQEILSNCDLNGDGMISYEGKVQCSVV